MEYTLSRLCFAYSCCCVGVASGMCVSSGRLAGAVAKSVRVACVGKDVRFGGSFLLLLSQMQHNVSSVCFRKAS